jgi:hypothetical protein
MAAATPLTLIAVFFDPENTHKINDAHHFFAFKKCAVTGKKSFSGET